MHVTMTDVVEGLETMQLEIALVSRSLHTDHDCQLQIFSQERNKKKEGRQVLPAAELIIINDVWGWLNKRSYS